MILFTRLNLKWIADTVLQYIAICFIKLDNKSLMIHVTRKKKQFSFFSSEKDTILLLFEAGTHPMS